MKRPSAIVLAIGTVALLLAGCGASASDGTDANGLRKGSSTTSTPSATKPSSAAAPTSPAAARTPATDQPGSTETDPSKTTCAEFKKLDNEAEKALIEQILAAHPDSTFAGSPNVALGTAKLVCLSGSVADTPVAVAAGLIPK